MVSVTDHSICDKVSCSIPYPAGMIWLLPCMHATSCHYCRCFHESKAVHVSSGRIEKSALCQLSCCQAAGNCAGNCAGSFQFKERNHLRASSCAIHSASSDQFPVICIRWTVCISWNTAFDSCVAGLRLVYTSGQRAHTLNI